MGLFILELFLLAAALKIHRLSVNEEILIVYSAPAFVLNVLVSWENFLNIKSQVKFKQFFSPQIFK